MILTSQIAFLLLINSALSLHAAPREWKSADDQHPSEGELMIRDTTSINILLTKDCDQLALNDRTWIDSTQTLATTEASNESPAFDTLTFNDSRETVLAKLKASKFVVMTADETFIGRSGLNGVFRTRRKIGNLSASLYFDWTENGKLKEITLQTDLLPATAYQSTLAPSWKEFEELLGALHGKPVQKSSLPQIASLTDGSFSPTHLWKLENRGSALLGIARDGAKYQVVVRFTQKMIQPVEIP